MYRSLELDCSGLVYMSRLRVRIIARAQHSLRIEIEMSPVNLVEPPQ